MRTRWVISGWIILAFQQNGRSQSVVATMYWPVSGHQYSIVDMGADTDWIDADKEAKSMGGYLATLDLAGEEAVVLSLISPTHFHDNIGPWLGATQAEGSAEPAGGWGWINGEPWNPNWQVPQPNDACPGKGNNENRLHFLGSADPKWNDLPDHGCVEGAPHLFVLEQECGGPTTASVAYYGTGVPGKNCTPTITIDPPVIGSSPTLMIDNCSGLVGTTTFLTGGVAPASLDFECGQLLVQPPWALFRGLPTLGPGLSFSATIPCDPTLDGVSFYLQGIQFDPDACNGGSDFSMTEGVELILGGV
jgi:hypothetical protein